MNDRSTAKLGYDFLSDNTGAASPEIIAGLIASNKGTAVGYGKDPYTDELQRRFGELFETAVRVFPVPTGTAANALSLAAISPPWGAVYCSKDAHIETSEANATAFLGGGVKVAVLEGEHGKIAPGILVDALSTAGLGQTYRSQPAAVSLTQATDLGAVYSVDQIRAIGEVARQNKLAIHMDGARLANALATLGCSPAAMTWQAGVDILSFGMTKNGGLLCDAIVVFRADLAERLSFLLRRSGQTWSKMRYAAAQLLAYVEDDLWLRNARQANATAAQIADALKQIPGARLLAPVEANEVFLELDQPTMDRLAADGILFFRRSPKIARFVCRWDTSNTEAIALIESLRRQFRSRE
ncbi:threonine aldolase family protein [Leptospira interrogans]